MTLIDLILPISLFTFIIAVFLSKNPVYGVLSFVAIVIHVVVILVILDLEFLAYVLAIVYIGAIVVLFLFVIMMFYIHVFHPARSLLRGSMEYFILGSAATMLAYYCAFFDTNTYTDFTGVLFNSNFLIVAAWYLFNDGLVLTFLAALLMLISIIGAVVLTVKPSTTTSLTMIKSRSVVSAAIDKKIK